MGLVVGPLAVVLDPVVDLRRKSEFLVVVNVSFPVLTELTKVFDFSVNLSSSASSSIVYILFLRDLCLPPKKKQLVVLHEL